MNAVPEAPAVRAARIRQRIEQDAPAIAAALQNAATQAVGNEARFRTLFAITVEPWAAQLGIELQVREERTLVTGRADATFNRLVIEYEPPGSLRNNPQHAATAHAIQQAKDYVEGLAAEEAQPAERLIGVATDGHFFAYARKLEGHWLEPEIEPVNTQSIIRFLQILVSLTSGRALLATNLVSDFGVPSAVVTAVFPALYDELRSRIEQTPSGLAARLLDQWSNFFAQATGYEEASARIAQQRAFRQFVTDLGLDPDTVDLQQLFFVMHTYFSLLIKLVAYYALSRFVSPLGNRFGSMYCLDDASLLHEMSELERGGLYRTLGIRNFLEGDFFKWYLETWSPGIADGVRALLTQLREYDPGSLSVAPDQTRDLLKKLYHRLLPRWVRHDLGEYYTPDWLAEHVTTQAGYEGQIDARVLDPACGSGTFLVTCINRLRQNCLLAGRNEQETLDLILNNVVGIDLNPLAVIASRTNYLLALGDLLAYRNREIDIPVYLADSIVIPAPGSSLQTQATYPLRTSVGTFGIPSSLTTREQIDSLCNLVEECVTTGASREAFLVRARNALALSDEDWNGDFVRGEGAGTIIGQLFDDLADLHRQQLNGIWARILQNAFMPVFLGRFDFVVGNPPWINWESLPAAYRQETAPLWVMYRLFAHTGMATILGSGKKDLSMLMSCVVANRLLRDGGRMAFLITQTVFKSGSARGFRRFRLLSSVGTPLAVREVHDFTDFQPFEGATNRTSVS